MADYLIDAGKELVDKCEDLYERSGELVEDATHGLSGKYRARREYSKQLLDEAETILRRTKNRENAPTGKYIGTSGGGTIKPHSPTTSSVTWRCESPGELLEEWKANVESSHKKNIITITHGKEPITGS